MSINYEGSEDRSGIIHKLNNNSASSINLTVTGSGWTTTTARATSYKTIKNDSRMSFGISGVTSGTVSTLTLTISGVSFKTGIGNQILTVYGGSIIGTAYGTDGASTIIISIGTASNSFNISGDVQIN